MKWIGILVIVLGFVAFIAVTSFEMSMPLVQFVDKETVVSRPVHILLPPGTQFIKGTGEDGAKFVDVHSDAIKYLGMPRYMTLAKLGTLAMCALGAIGFAFESWREKTRRSYSLELPPELVRAVKRVNDIEDEVEAGIRFHGVSYFEGVFSPDTEELWCHVKLTEEGLLMWSKEMSRTIPYSHMKKVSQTKWKGTGTGVQIECDSERIWMTCRRSNFRGWILGVDYPETLKLFQNLSRKVRESRIAR